MTPDERKEWYKQAYLRESSQPGYKEKRRKSYQRRYSKNKEDILKQARDKWKNLSREQKNKINLQQRIRYHHAAKEDRKKSKDFLRHIKALKRLRKSLTFKKPKSQKQQKKEIFESQCLNLEKFNDEQKNAHRHSPRFVKLY